MINRHQVDNELKAIKGILLEGIKTRPLQEGFEYVSAILFYLIGEQAIIFLGWDENKCMQYIDHLASEIKIALHEEIKDKKEQEDGR